MSMAADDMGPVVPLRTRGAAIDPKAPLIVAKLFVHERHTRDGNHTLRFDQGTFREWIGSVYAAVSPDRIRAQLYDFLDRKTDPEGRAIKPTRKIVDDHVDALRAVCHLEAQAPCWIGPAPFPANEVLAHAGGLLHLPTRQAMAATPNFFTHNAVGFAYDPAAPHPVRWLEFLADIWADDPDSIAALQEWMGLLLTLETRYQKALMIVGPKRSGKGTIARILRALVGTANVCSPMLSSLAHQFGLEGLIAKQLAIISDARIGSKVDIAAIAENILRVTGEDAVSVPRKHRPDWVGQLAVRFVLLTNEVPALADASGALASRFIVLRMTRSFYGTEDTLLTDRLSSELPGILLWALDGLDRLRARGHLVQPRTGLQVLDALDALGSPVKAFVADRCIVAPAADIPCSALFEEWQAWCREQGRDHPGTLQVFGRNLSAAFPGIQTVRPRKDGHRARWYAGIRLRNHMDPDPDDQTGPHWSASQCIAPLTQETISGECNGSDRGPSWTSVEDF